MLASNCKHFLHTLLVLFYIFGQILQVMAQFYPLTVSHIKRETPNSVVVTFTIPDNLQDVFTFLPGQYITIKKELNNTELRRSYSICSPAGSKDLSVGIKKVKGGTFSVYANNELQVGDTLQVSAPEGKFVLKPDNNSRTVAAFAAGSGITPIMSIMQSLLKNEPNSTFILVFGNQSVTETMFYNQITELAQKYSQNLSVYFVYSRTKEGNALFGRIDASVVNYVINNKHKNQHIDAFYLCGPEGMITTVKEQLIANGVSENAILTELFTTSSDAVSASEDIAPGKTKVTGVVDDDSFSFIMDKKQRVLDAALDNNVDAPYSCQGGICSSCIARVKEGKVTMANNQILTDAEIAEGLILTCQSHPVTDTLVIDYDDV